MSNDNKYFNVITKGFSYINDARVIPVDGGDSYLAVRVSLLEGHEDKVRYTYVDCIVKGEKPIALVQQFQSQIADDDQKVTAVVELGSLKVKPFTYKSGAKQGQPGAALKASLIGITYLKVGDQVIDLGLDTDTSSDSQADVDDVAEPASDAQAVETSQEEADQSPKLKVVELSKDDPNFETRKAELKEQGYKWDRDLTAWTLPIAA